MDYHTPLTATLLSFSMGFQQIAGHGEDHNHLENLVPLPWEVRPPVFTTATSGAPSIVNADGLFYPLGRSRMP